VAVIGVSRNPEKYGYKVWKDLKQKGYEVYGVNPNADEIDGEKIYCCLEELPSKPDIVDFVVPPQIAYEILKKYSTKHRDVVFWFQPGSESEESMNLCKERNLKCVFNFCIMQESNKEDLKKAVTKLIF